MESTRDTDAIVSSNHFTSTQHRWVGFIQPANTPFLRTLATHSINTPYRHTLSPRPVSTLSYTLPTPPSHTHPPKTSLQYRHQYLLSRRTQPINTPPFSTPFNKHYQHPSNTPSNTPYQPRPLTPPLIPGINTFYPVEHNLSTPLLLAPPLTNKHYQHTL